MPPNNKKKKKPQAGPVRGFATTSVASRNKQSLEQSEKSESTSEVGDTNSATPANETDGAKREPIDKAKELHELSPEELEARLEEAELQGLVQKYSAKTSRDASRQISKLTTDCRVLRTQAIPLPTRGLLPDSLTAKIAALAKDEIAQGVYSTDQKTTKRLTGENAFPRLWTIQQVLRALEFPADLVTDALKHLLAHPPHDLSSDPLCGLDECFDYLVLNAPVAALPLFDTRTGKPRDPKSAPESRPDTPSGSELDVPTGAKVHPSIVNQPQSKSSSPDVPEEGSIPVGEDFIVSDLESDLEPEELLSTYLSAKSRLYEVRPDLAESASTSSKRTKKQNELPAADPKVLPGITKLQNKIKHIESDVLFDKYEADQQWVSRRNVLAQQMADKRKLLSPPFDTKESAEDNAPRKDKTRGVSKSEQSLPPREVSDAGSSDEDDDGIGGLFAAESDLLGSSSNLVSTEHDDQERSSVTVRNFGQTKGLDPKRVLKEACRARDSNAKLEYKTISRTSFSNRQSLTITWSKDQDTSLALNSATIDSQTTARSSVFVMQKVSTPESGQSEALISTFAMFQLFALSAKEEKAYLRLPSAWRGFWDELSEQRKTQMETHELQNVKELQAIIHAEPQEDEDEDIIYTGNLKRRNGGDGVVTPDNRDITSNSISSEQLNQIWQSKSSTPAYQKMLQSRNDLPIALFRDQAMNAIEQNQVTIICGETGCGKSTQMPSFILERELSSGRPCKIYCAEPRRISAITLAQRVSEELGENKHDLGTGRSLVGFAIRLQNEVVSSTRLVYATTGIVLRMLESSEGFKDITHIIIDEVHERSIETDFLLIILRSLITKRPDLKVVLMSATVDAQRFSSYFNGAPTLNVPGRTFPVETRFLEDAIELTGHMVGDDNGREEVDLETEDTDTQADRKDIGVSNLQKYSPQTRSTLSKLDEYRIDFDLICKLIDFISSDPDYREYGKAILVFLPGIQEIRRLQDMLSGTPVGQHYLIHTLHSTIASEDQQRAFSLPPHGLGKIVLSTNIAETGVTIPDITCVIDTGKHKEMRFDERRQISRLIESFISRANAKQRRGRAGRVQRGLAFHLFTKARHDQSIADQQTPEMLRLSLQDLIMRVKITKLGDIQTALGEALDPPSPKNIRRAIDALIEVGALTQSEELTSLGIQLSKIPLDPYLGKLVLYGSLFKCLDICVTLAAMLTSKSPFVTPVGARKQADLARQSFKKGDSDLLTDFNAYAAWRRVCISGGMSEWQFCKKSCLSVQTLTNIEDLKAQLLSAASESGHVQLNGSERSALGRIHNSGSRQRRFVSIPNTYDENSEDNEMLSAVIAWSFYPKILTREGKGWRSLASSQSISLHPTSIVRHTPITNVKYLSYYSILQSSGTKNYNANSLTPVAPLHLALLAGDSTFHSTAHVVAIDGARLRFSVDNWKTFIALKYLRRRLEEIVARRWKKPDGDLPSKLKPWMDIWSEIVDGWKGKGD